MLVTLKSVKPEMLADEGDSLAAHLRRSRKARGLKQIEVAALMDVDEHSIVDWEHGTEPQVSMYPTILRFLGYEPWEKPTTLEGQLQAERRRRGLSAKATARLLNVDEGTYARWERGRWPHDLHWQRVAGFLGIRER